MFGAGKYCCVTAMTLLKISTQPSIMLVSRFTSVKHFNIHVQQGNLSQSSFQQVVHVRLSMIFHHTLDLDLKKTHFLPVFT